MTHDPRYPIGPFTAPATVTSDAIERWIGEIERLPTAFRAAVEPLTEAQLDTPYRPGGWTVRQLVHHVPDSHLSSYVRCKWTLTENRPTIKAYDEKLWAELPDSRDTPVAVSLALLESLHTRWVVLLRSLTPADREREFIHPETGSALSLNTIIALYAWHGRHHLAHITSLVARQGW